MKRTVFALAAFLLAACAAQAAPPEIGHIYPDFAGNHMAVRQHAGPDGALAWDSLPHVVTGEGLAPGTEIYVWNLQSTAATIERAAGLLGTKNEPRPPAAPPLAETGRRQAGPCWIKSGYPDWDAVYRLAPLSVDGRVMVADLRAGRKADMDDEKKRGANIAPHMMEARHIRLHPSVVWLKNKDGFSRPYLINIPQPRWMNEPVLQQGQLLRIYGLGLNIGREKSRLAFRRGNETRILLPQEPPYWKDQSDTRLLEMLIPYDLQPGDYTVYVHNGLGGQFGWAKAGPLKIEARRKVEEKLFRVRDYGALGNGEANDTAAVRKALEAAKAALSSPREVQERQSVVYFSPGTYIVDESLTVPSGVNLRGADRGNTVIRGVGYDPGAEGGWRTFAAAGILAPRQPAPVLRMQPWTGLQRIMVSGAVAVKPGTPSLSRFENGLVYMVVGDEKTPSLPRGATRGRVSLREVRLEAVTNSNADSGQDSQVYGGAFGGGDRHEWVYGMEVIDSDFRGGVGSAGLVIRGDFINNRVSDGAIAMLGAFDTFIERNVMMDSPTRFHLHHPLHNTYVRANEIYNFGTGRVGVHGASEAFLPHGGSRKWVGKVSGATGGTLTDSKRKWEPGQLAPGQGRGPATVVITAGRGFGQFRMVKSNTENTLTTDEPWRVIPDAGSEYVVGNLHTGNAFYDNYLDGLGFFGQDADHLEVVVEKQRHNHAGELFSKGEDGSGNQMPRLTWYTMFLNCHLDGSGITFHTWECEKRPASGPVAFADAFVGNNIIQPRFRSAGSFLGRPEEQGVGIAFTPPFPRGGWKATGRTSHILIVANSIHGAETGVLVRDYARKTFVLDNVFRAVEHPIIDGGSGSVQRGNQVLRFSTTDVGRMVTETLPDLRRPDPLRAIKPEPVEYKYP